MKTDTINKLCASYMENVRGVKKNTPNRNFVLRLIEDTYKAGLEDAYKGIKKMDWERYPHKLVSKTFVGEFVIKPLLNGGFGVSCNNGFFATRTSLTKAKKIANWLYRMEVKRALGL